MDAQRKTDRGRDGQKFKQTERDKGTDREMERDRPRQTQTDRQTERETVYLFTHHGYVVRARERQRRATDR